MDNSLQGIDNKSIKIHVSSHCQTRAKALEELQERAHVDHTNGETNGHEPVPSAPTLSQKARKPIWEALIEASLEIPEEELDLLPADGATQHDHYIYGTPKRPA